MPWQSQFRPYGRGEGEHASSIAEGWQTKGFVKQGQSNEVRDGAREHVRLIAPGEGFAVDLISTASTGSGPTNRCCLFRFPLK